MICCNHLFSEFCFQDLRSAGPPDQKGVYVVRTTRRGADIGQIIAQVQRLLHHLDWEIVEDFVINQMDRLKRITECPVIYIGANQNKGKNTLSDRYSELANRHTIMYPMWALIYHGWDFDFGWQVTSDPEALEGWLKQQYRALHEGKLPALVSR
jgi:hypothetical protein